MQFRSMFWLIDRWRKSAAYMDMSLAEQGAYRNLLDEAALRGGSLPNDERILAKACGDPRRWKRVRPAVMRKFILKDEHWHHETLNRVLTQSVRRMTRAQNFRKKRSTGNVSKQN
jgi:uncharacterized protein YdaU (DUF1376 family)